MRFPAIILLLIALAWSQLGPYQTHSNVGASAAIMGLLLVLACWALVKFLQLVFPG